MIPTKAWQFTLFGFPVRVQLSFLLITLLLGLNSGNLILIVFWVIIVFFSILLHELGHAFVSRAFGRYPYIELTWSGGLTITSRNSMLSFPQEIMISFAGPLAGFIAGGLVYGFILLAGTIPNYYLSSIVSQLLWVNIGWGVFNLIPILPLDGGNIMLNIYRWITNSYDMRTPLKISIGFGILTILAVVIFFNSGGLYIALLIGLLTYNNFSNLQRGSWSGGMF